MIEIRRYTSDDKAEWDTFVASSKNATFLFMRDYMDYHSDRFTDCSLMIYRREKLYALFPANKEGTTIVSHGGLTYGGLLMNDRATAQDIVETFTCINEKLRSAGITSVVYKPVPWIYHSLPAEEDLYAVFNTCKARLLYRSISSTVSRNTAVKWHRIRLCGMKKATDAGIITREERDPHAFWHILTANLRGKYGVNPVHNVDEMALLMSRFPDNIRLFTAVKDGIQLAGTVLYITRTTVHTQYISASDDGKRLHALDKLIADVMQMALTDHEYFDFGISTEDHGRVLNSQLIYQKEGFGGRGVCYDTYQWDV